jgi:hypothetical protein
MKNVRVGATPRSLPRKSPLQRPNYASFNPFSASFVLSSFTGSRWKKLRRLKSHLLYIEKAVKNELGLLSFPEAGVSREPVCSPAGDAAVQRLAGA